MRRESRQYRSKFQRVCVVSACASALTLASTAASAQCTDTFNVFATVSGVDTPVQNLVPLGTGTALSSFIATMNTINTAFLTSTSAFVGSPSNGGAWGRVVGGKTDTTSSSTGTVDIKRTPFQAANPGFVASGTQTCKTTATQTYVGTQVGYDMSLLKGGSNGPNFHLGATAGYFEGRTKDTTGAGSYFNSSYGGTFRTPAGTFTADTVIPFVGAYALFKQGNFFVDGLGRFDFYKNEFNDTANGLRDSSLDAKGTSLTANIGYNIPLGDSGWFIEPGAGLVLSRVSVDTLSVPGANGVAGKGTVEVDDIDSRLGRLSLTAGTSFVAAGIGWSPYITVSSFKEFASNVTAVSTATATGVNFTDLQLLSSVDRLGSYTQVGLGTSAVFGNTGWLGYARVDYKRGDNIEGTSGNVGVRYQW